MAKYDKTTHNHLPKRWNRRLRIITLQPKRRSSQSLPTIRKRTKQCALGTQYGVNKVIENVDNQIELPKGWIDAQIKDLRIGTGSICDGDWILSADLKTGK